MEYLNNVTRKTNAGNFLLLYLKITDLTYSTHLNLNTQLFCINSNTANLF